MNLNIAVYIKRFKLNKFYLLILDNGVEIPLAMEIFSILKIVDKTDKICTVNEIYNSHKHILQQRHFLIHSFIHS